MAAEVEAVAVAAGPCMGPVAVVGPETFLPSCTSLPVVAAVAGLS